MWEYSASSFAPSSSAWPCSNFGSGSFFEMTLLVLVAAGGAQDQPVWPRSLPCFWREWKTVRSWMPGLWRQTPRRADFGGFCLIKFLLNKWVGRAAGEKFNFHRCWWKKRDTATWLWGCFGVHPDQYGKKHSSFSLSRFMLRTYFKELSVVLKAPLSIPSLRLAKVEREIERCAAICVCGCCDSNKSLHSYGHSNMMAVLLAPCLSLCYSAEFWPNASGPFTLEPQLRKWAFIEVRTNTSKENDTQ